MTIIGQTISHYQIIEKLGQGGMGVVYRARDTQLDRDAALKFLPANALTDEEMRARFRREAKAAAQLNHPNIATVFGIGETDNGQAYIAMELVDGETLSETIRRRPLKLEDVINIGRQLVDGLQAAHNKGIVHRDIKSSNVMLDDAGRVKIMDFGLAMTAASTRLTKTSSTLGTASYMSPEQALGEAVDKRTDIWSLGVVLYEMISGTLPFRADYDHAAVYAILHEAPEPLTALRTGVPTELERVVMKCLEKDGERRYQNVEEVGVDLRSSSTMASNVSTSTLDTPPVAEARTANAWRFAIPLSAVVALLSGAIGWILKPEAQLPPQSAMKFSIPLSSSERLHWLEHSFDLSPDGAYLAYVATSETSGLSDVKIRPLDAIDASVVPGSDDADNLFFSPDSKWLGFHAKGSLKKYSIESGATTTLARVSTGVVGASWCADGTIIFAPNGPIGLWGLSEETAVPEKLTSPDPKRQEVEHHSPHEIPGTKSVLFTIDIDDSSDIDDSHIGVLDLETLTWKHLSERGGGARYAASGHLIYGRSDGLMAAPFDLDMLETTGASIPVLPGVRTSWWEGANYAFSDTGILAYAAGGISTRSGSLVEVDRTGRAGPLVPDVREYYHPRFSPDARHLGMTVAQKNNWDLWTIDLENQVLDRRFSGCLFSVWDSDGQRLSFYDVSSSRGMKWMPADGSGSAELLLKGQNAPSSFSPDGRFIAFTEINPVSQMDLWIFDIETRSALPFLVTDANEAAASFSPDGRWIAYVSDISGQTEVYVKPYPDTGASYQVSIEGGSEPMWSRDGSEIFYRAGSAMMAVSVEADDEFYKGVPARLFDGPYYRDWFSTGFFPNYDVDIDGRFVMVEVNLESLPQQINIATNWFTELERLVPTDK